MKVSIIIPIYNSEKTIKETFESIKIQSYKNIEVIFINDGSIDHSAQIVKACIAESSIVCKYFEIPNSGPSIARNKGAEYATGDLLMFLDADDLLAVDYIEKAVHILKTKPHINLVYGNVELFGEQTGLWPLKDYALPDFLLENCIPIFALIRRKHFVDLNGFDTNMNFAEDWDLWIRLIRKYDGVHKIPETVYYYRKHTESNSLTDKMFKNNKIDASRLYIFNKHYDWYLENNLSLTHLIHNTIHLNTYKNKKRSFFSKLFKK